MLGSTRYFGLSLYDNENDFYSPCTYERRTTYRSLSPSTHDVQKTSRIYVTRGHRQRRPVPTELNDKTR